MDAKLKNKLNKRIEEGTLRSLSSFEGAIDFFSNDYLGLSKVQFPTTTNSLFGSTGSRLISGTSSIALESEQKLAEFFEVDAALIFNSGYDANLGFFSAVPQRGDTILYDEYVHASVRDGMRLSFADTLPFKHNDIHDLESKLRRIQGVVYVAIESLYSMDGDIAPLMEIANICKQNNAYLIVDEAHACGVFGEQGKGLINREGIEKLVFARLVTFGKAFGAHGAVILGEQDLIDFLINFSRSFIYTTALPPESYARIVQAVTYEGNQFARQNLCEVITQFRTDFNSFHFSSDHQSPIQLLEIGNVQQTKQLAEKLQAQKFAIKPIYSPTIPKGREGLRICLHSFNSKEELSLLHDLITLELK